jgi:hypothetical protein
MYELDRTRFNNNSNGFAPDFYAWVTGIFKYTNYVEKILGDPSVVAMSGGGTLTLGKLFSEQNLVDRTSTLVHEARHSQEGDPGHVKCTHGDMTRYEDACDAEFSKGNFAGSGYNYEFTFEWWARDGARQTDLRQDILNAGMRYLLLNRFNTISNDDIQRFYK